MKTHRWWIILLLAVSGCGPVSYWANNSTGGLFDFLNPATSRYKYPPGYDPGTPTPRTGPVPKKIVAPLPLPGDDAETPGATASDAAAKPADGSTASTPPSSAKL